MTELPKGWERVRLADVAEVRLGRQRSPKRATGDRMRPYLRAANVTWRGLDLSDVKEMDFTASESETYELRPGDLLLSEASGSPGEVGKPAQYQGEIDGCCFQNTLIRVRLPNGLLPDFYEYFFREQALNGRFAARSRGVGIHHLGAVGLSDWTAPVPPHAEQERIVAAIEEAFSKLDAGEAGLRTVRQVLKRMRDALLTAAVTGRLVPQDPTDTPATKLLADLGVEPIEQDERPAVPDGWAGSLLGNVARWSSGGTPKSDEPSYYGGRIPWAVIGDLSDGLVRDTASSITDAGLANSSAKVVEPGTVLVAMYGSIGKLGVAAVPMATNQAIACAVPSTAVTRNWLFLWLRAQRNELIDAGRGGTQSNISQRILKGWPIAVPPVPEQLRIVAEVERQLSFVEACERAVDTGLERSAALRRSVLKAAFEGRLVPQDLTDEPASVLVERIRAEQAAAPKPARRGRTTA
jgi:type I restriction enzyme S subunit